MLVLAAEARLVLVGEAIPSFLPVLLVDEPARYIKTKVSSVSRASPGSSSESRLNCKLAFKNHVATTWEFGFPNRVEKSCLSQEKLDYSTPV